MRLASRHFFDIRKGRRNLHLWFQLIPKQPIATPNTRSLQTLPRWFWSVQGKVFWTLLRSSYQEEFARKPRRNLHLSIGYRRWRFPDMSVLACRRIVLLKKEIANFFKDQVFGLETNMYISAVLPKQRCPPIRAIDRITLKPVMHIEFKIGSASHVLQLSAFTSGEVDLRIYSSKNLSSVFRNERDSAPIFIFSS